MNGTQERIDALVKQTRERANEYGLGVRCPECNVGIGRWCRQSVEDQTSPVVKHAARLELASRSPILWK